MEEVLKLLNRYLDEFEAWSGLDGFEIRLPSDLATLIFGEQTEYRGVPIVIDSAIPVRRLDTGFQSDIQIVNPDLMDDLIREWLDQDHAAIAGGMAAYQAIVVWTT